VLTDAKAVFEQMADAEGLDFSFEQLDVYRKAQELESKSRKFYLVFNETCEPGLRRGWQHGPRCPAEKSGKDRAREKCPVCCSAGYRGLPRPIHCGAVW
jgi:hypothetical protein